MGNLDNDDWKYAFAAYEFSKEPKWYKPEMADVDRLMSTVVSCILLKMCTNAYREILINQNPQRAL